MALHPNECFLLLPCIIKFLVLEAGLFVSTACLIAEKKITQIMIWMGKRVLDFSFLTLAWLSSGFEKHV